MLTVATFREVQEAHLFAGRLRAEGIHASVAFQYHVGNNWAYSTALGGAIVQVTNDDYVESKSIERLSRSGEFKRQLEDVFGDLDDLRCPNCGATDYWKRRPIYQGILSIVALFSVGILPPWRWIYFCNVCGTKFGALYGLIGKAAGDFHFSAAYSKAAISDIPEMRQLRGRSNNSGASPKTYESILAGSGQGWVCRIGGVLRGFSLASRETRSLAALFVDQDFKRDGIGRQLHKSAVDWLFDDGIDTLSLTIVPTAVALAFLYRAGWKLADEDDQGPYRLDLQADDWRRRRAKF